jgi:hypothetical protein
LFNSFRLFSLSSTKQRDETRKKVRFQSEKKAGKTVRSIGPENGAPCRGRKSELREDGMKGFKGRFVPFFLHQIQCDSSAIMHRNPCERECNEGDIVTRKEPLISWKGSHCLTLILF